MDPEIENSHFAKCLCTNDNSDSPGGRQPGRRLVVAFDGTENQFGPQVRKNSSRRMQFITLRVQSSHVVEFYSRIVRSGDQQAYYTSGIGTFVQSSSILRRPRRFIKHKWASLTAR